MKQWRGTQRYLPIQRVDEDALTRDIVTLASQYGRYGYRRITALLRTAGWQVGKDRVQRIWRREGLKVPKKQKPRRRLWFNDGSCVRLRDECLNGEIFYSLKEAQIVIEKWRVEYNTRRPHSSLGYRPPAPAACSPIVPPNSSSQAMVVM